MRAVLLAPVLLAAGCGVGTAATPERTPERTPEQASGTAWRSSAAQAMSDMHPVAVREQTCRQVLRVSVAGDRLRLRLSNALSPTPLVLGAVTVALRETGAAARSGSVRPVTARGRGAFTVPPGEQVVTDPVTLPVGDGDDVLVSFAVTGSAVLSEHRYGSATGWCSAAGTGDRTAQPGGDGFLGGSRAGLVVDDVALETAAAASVVVVGDSLTDALLPPDTYPRWTDVLDRALPRTPVVNAAIAGNRVVVEGGLGPTLVERFGRDVLQRAGAGAVVLLAGTNDLARDLPAARLAAELEELAAAARAAGLRVVLMTIPPAAERTGGQREARRAVNAWIRTGGAADVVVDADAVLRDPQQPERLLPAYDYGDGLHLSPEGHRALGQAAVRALR